MNSILPDQPSSAHQAWQQIRILAARIELYPTNSEPSLIAAVDTAYGTEGRYVYSSAVVTTLPQVDLVECALARRKILFPYYPGLLYFREGPVMLKALQSLSHTPDIIIVSGHGIAHPERCGIASAVGLASGLPSVGCSLRLLCGHHRPVAEAKGSLQPIMLNGREVGIALRSRRGVKPIFLSPGHRCDLDAVLNLARLTLREFRIPEPLRLAHLFVNKYKREAEDN